MDDRSKSRYGAVALGLSIGGMVLAILIVMVAKLLGYQASMPAYLVFFGFQIAAFVMGLISRKEPLGKTAYITSAVLAFCSFAFLA